MLSDHLQNAKSAPKRECTTVSIDLVFSEKEREKADAVIKAIREGFGAG